MYGQYQVIERIAVGGMAEIYLGMAQGVEGFARSVVIKKVRQRYREDDRFRAMLIKEAKITASLNHPNIVQILDLGQNDRDEYFIVMEYVDGYDLRSVMEQAARKKRGLKLEEVLYIATEICSALDYAHNKTGGDGRPLKLIHRDVSPANILISRAGEVKLADFGIARYGRDVSVVGSLKGKLGYMSPEQAQVSRVDRRSDIFSLGAVLYEVMLGRRIFVGDSDVELLEAARIARVPRPSLIDATIPRELERILIKALARDPDRRFLTAAKMGHELLQLLVDTTENPAGPDMLSALLGECFGVHERQSFSSARERFRVSTVVDLREEFLESITSTSRAPAGQIRRRALEEGDGHGLDEALAADTVERSSPSAGGLEEVPTDPTGRPFFTGSIDIMKVVTGIEVTEEDEDEHDTAADIALPAAAPGEAPHNTAPARSPTARVFHQASTHIKRRGGEGLEERFTPVVDSPPGFEDRPAPVVEVPSQEAILEVETLDPLLQQEPTIRKVETPTEEQAAAQQPRLSSADSRGAVPPGFGVPGVAAAAPAAAERVAAAPPRRGKKNTAVATWLMVAVVGLGLGGGTALFILSSAPKKTPLAVAAAAPGPARFEAGGGPTAAPSPPRDAAVNAREVAGAAAASPDGTATPGRVPDGARAETGPPPATGSVKPARKKRGPGRRRAGSAPAPDRRPPKPRPRPAPASRATGSVVIKSDPWAYLHIDGKKTGRTTSARPFPLPAGKHRIVLVNPALGLRAALTIEIPAGGVVRRFVRLK